MKRNQRTINLKQAAALSLGILIIASSTIVNPVSAEAAYQPLSQRTNAYKDLDNSILLYDVFGKAYLGVENYFKTAPSPKDLEEYSIIHEIPSSNMRLKKL